MESKEGGRALSRAPRDLARPNPPSSSLWRREGHSSHSSPQSGCPRGVQGVPRPRGRGGNGGGEWRKPNRMDGE
eukprot:5376821-Pyramimonas_sp.AAC.1